MELVMSTLPKTWILDLDGTLVKHNGYKMDGEDSLLKGAREFLSQIMPEDMVIIVTSREKRYQEMTEKFLQKQGIRYDHIIYEAPYGERILLNDDKPSGLQMAYAVHAVRDEVERIQIQRDESL